MKLRRYPTNVKASVIRDYTNGLPLKDIKEKYTLRSSSLIYSWIRKDKERATPLSCGIAIASTPTNKPHIEKIYPFKTMFILLAIIIVLQSCILALTFLDL